MKRTVKVKRAQLVANREQVENLFDYLVLEARGRDSGKLSLNHADVKKRYGLK
jgi:hypothetical protein